VSDERLLRRSLFLTERDFGSETGCGAVATWTGSGRAALLIAKRRRLPDMEGEKSG
jgi:hypothetical protein